MIQRGFKGVRSEIFFFEESVVRRTNDKITEEDKLAKR